MPACSEFKHDLELFPLRRLVGKFAVSMGLPDVMFSMSPSALEQKR